MLSILGCSYERYYLLALPNQQVWYLENVRNVYCFVIFYHAQGDPIEVDVIHFRDTIPAGLAKRVNSNVHKSIQELTTHDRAKTPHTKIELRILDFEIIE